MEKEIKRKRGAPQGNQNARKHGFYSPLLDAEEQRDFSQAIMVEDIDEEIALLRVKLKSVVRHDPDNIKLIMQASESLARLLLAKYNLSKSDKKSLKTAIGNVLREIALPLGIGADIGKLIAK
jgi:hypothetical protein